MLFGFFRSWSDVISETIASSPDDADSYPRVRWRKDSLEMGYGLCTHFDCHLLFGRKSKYLCTRFRASK